MPFLQYKCINCDFEFERLVKNSQEDVFCAKCGKRVERIYSGTMFSATGKIIKKCSGNCKTCSGCK